MDRPQIPAAVDQRPLKPVFVVGGLYSLANGVAWIMRDLAAALGRAGSPATVCGADCWGRGAASIGHIFEPPTQWVSARGLWLGGLSWSPALKWKMQDAIREADVVHNHSLWMLPNSYGSRIAARQSKPVVITAHGALEPWALQNSGWKKELVGRWFQSEDLQRASCIQVNSLAEAEGIRQYGLRCPIAVIPNGIDPEPFQNLPDAGMFRQQHRELRDRRCVLFMARLHEKKGLGHLIPAWARVCGEFPDWKLTIAGPDCGYEQTARRLVRDLDLADRVTFVGNLQKEAKLAALSAAEVFVQPSFSEGFSMSVLEALASRCPVLITPGCNFPEVAEAGAGIIAEPTVEATATGLHELLGAASTQRRQMGERGWQLIESGYTWDSVAQRTLAMYEWLLQRAAAPSFVMR